MAAVKTNGVVITSGSGKHKDKRTKRRRTRGAAKRAAVRDQQEGR